MKAAIECENIGRTFVSRTLMRKKQQKVALHNLSFEVKPGIIFGLLGPNGAGKTTTVRILSTLLTPTSGMARVLGFDVVSEASQVRKRIGLILGGERGLYGPLTGVENLKYFAALNHMNHEYAQKRIKGLMQLVNLDSAADIPVRQYSRGMKQRLHVARGLLTDPELIFMDEPTIGLDPLGAQELRQFIPELVRQDKTILLTTHYMFEADMLCNQIAIINEGEMVVSGTPSQIKRSFSKITVLEAVLSQTRAGITDELTLIQGIKHIAVTDDELLQKLTIYVEPGVEVKEKVTEILGKDSIESIVLRDPTLEEAYLSIIQ